MAYSPLPATPAIITRAWLQHFIDNQADIARRLEAVQPNGILGTDGNGSLKSRPLPKGALAMGDTVLPIGDGVVTMGADGQPFYESSEDKNDRLETQVIITFLGA